MTESIVKQLEACALKAAQQANADANANSLERAQRVLAVCREALELLPIASDVERATAALKDES